MFSSMHTAPRLAPLTLQALPDDLKLKAINKMRADNKRSAVKSVPPAHITLTPSAPSKGAANFLSLQGYYASYRGNVQMRLGMLPSDSLILHFETAPGKTYLLDVGVGHEGSPSWYCYFMAGAGPLDSSRSTVTVENGHLLIPFISYGPQIQLAFFLPSAGQISWFLRAELTRVD